MSKRSVRTYPGHIVPDFMGSAIDDSSGFLVKANDRTDDKTQGMIKTSRADITPGFGTHHPQDVKNLGKLDDPAPISEARTQPDVSNLTSKADIAEALGMTLAEIDDYIARTGKLPGGAL